jgi:hypothetical protein
MLREAYELKKQLSPADYYYPNKLRTELENEMECLLKEPYEMSRFNKKYPGSSKY